MDNAAIENQVIALASDIIGVPLTRDSSMDNVPGWDSLRHMQLVFAFEDAFGLRLEDGEMSQLRSIEALVRRATNAS